MLLSYLDGERKCKFNPWAQVHCVGMRLPVTLSPSIRGSAVESTFPYELFVESTLMPVLGKIVETVYVATSS
jgi:hypothetical protein